MSHNKSPSHGGDHFATQGPETPSPHKPEVGADAFATGGMLANNTQELIPGQNIASRYVIIQTLGSGGMGQVYLVHDTLRNQEVALKRLHPHLANDTKLQQRFLEEIKIAERLSHPGFLKILGVDQDRERGELFYLMEFLPGETLEATLKRRGEQHFSLDETLRLLRPLGEALDALHQMGVIHRDLKPSNIYLPHDGHPRLMDLGIARILQDPSKQHTLPTNAGIGTAYYMAPEQLRGHTISTASDIFSLGVITYEMLTGQLPIGIPKPPSLLVPTLPKTIDDILFQTLDADPHERPASAGHFVRALASAQKAPKVMSPPVHFTPPPSPPPSAISKPSNPQVLASSPKTPSPQKPRPKMSFWLSLGLVAIAALGLATFYFSLETPVPKAPPKTQKPFSAPLENSPPQQQVPQQQVPQQQVPQQQVPPDPPQQDTSPRIPITLQMDSYKEWLQIDIRHSQLQVYPGSAFYRLQAVLTNIHPHKLLWRVGLELQLLDQNNQIVLRRRIRALSSYQPPLCKQDSHAFKLLEQTTPSIRKARLIVRNIRRPSHGSQPRPYCKRPLQNVSLKWSSAPPDGIQIHVQERPNYRPRQASNRFMRRVFGPGTHHYFHWVIQNTGKEALQLLKLGVTFYNASGQIIRTQNIIQRAPQDMKTLYVIATDDPPLRPGEKRLAGTIAKLPDEYSRYELTVVEFQ